MGQLTGIKMISNLQSQAEEIKALKMELAEPKPSPTTKEREQCVFK